MIHHHWTGKEFVEIDVPPEIVGRIKENRRWCRNVGLIGVIAGAVVLGLLLDEYLGANSWYEVILGVLFYASIGIPIAGLWLADKLHYWWEARLFERYLRFGAWPSD